jgi:hypothetical protein
MSEERLARTKSLTVFWWLLVVFAVVLNAWFDYYHPLGLIFDVVLGVGLFIAYLRSS